MLAEVHGANAFRGCRSELVQSSKGIVREARWTQITGIFAYSTAGGLLELLDPIELLACAVSPLGLRIG